MGRIAEDCDGGVTKRQVIEEARDGWERLKVEGCPTLLLPAGDQRPYLALPRVKMDRRQRYRVVAYTPAPVTGDAALDTLRGMFAETEARHR